MDWLILMKQIYHLLTIALYHLLYKITFRKISNYSEGFGHYIYYYFSPCNYKYSN